MAPELTMALQLGVIFTGLGVSYGGLRWLVGRTEEDVKALRASLGKQAEVAANQELKIAALERTVVDLDRRHSEGMRELREKAADVHGRTTALERTESENRVRLENLAQTLTRVETKQDAAGVTTHRLLELVLKQRASGSPGDP